MYHSKNHESKTNLSKKIIRFISKSLKTINMKNDLRIFIFKVPMSWHFNVSYLILISWIYKTLCLGCFFLVTGDLYPGYPKATGEGWTPFHFEASIFWAPIYYTWNPKANHFIKWMEVRWFPTIFYVKIWNHPVETSIYKWYRLGFQVLATALSITVKNLKMGIICIIEKLDNGDILHGRKQTITWKTNPSFDWLVSSWWQLHPKMASNLPPIFGVKNSKKYFLVGGFNPYERYEPIWESYPNFRDEHKKYLSCHHLVHYFFGFVVLHQ